MTIQLIDLGITFLSYFLKGLPSQTPANVVAAVQAAIDAIGAHKDDLITKANLEAQRG